MPSFENIISIDNLLLAWKEFVRDKKSKKDVQIFQQRLMENVISLHRDLMTKKYKHSDYEMFNISDPKPRNIHKASVRDRLLHHALYRILYPYFDRRFISDSYSCRFRKGTHRAVKAFHIYANKVSKNNTRQVWVLKCDIKKFFASVDQKILIQILKKHISDKDTMNLLIHIIESFHSTKEGVGLPLGNLTSQLLVNIYMNEFDQFMKHRLKAKYYIRYADDFVVLHEDKDVLLEWLPKMGEYLEDNLKLNLHPDKVFIKTLASGVDFLGWVNFPDHRILRTVTKRRMFRKIKEKEDNEQSISSYLGMLSHGNTKRLAIKIERMK